MNHSEWNIADEVKRFQDDVNKLGLVCSEKGWQITADWAIRFNNHLKSLIPLAERGDPIAQYNVAIIYMNGYLYSSESAAKNNYEIDKIEMSKWLECAARAGIAAALDNLITSGVGAESDRIRELYYRHKNDLENGPPPSEAWQRDMTKLHHIAYLTG